MSQYGKLVPELLTTTILIWLTWIVVTTHELRFLDGVNLIFHEAGHFIFFAPAFLSVLGGTLMQLLIPLAVTLHFLAQRALLSFSIMVWWFGQNLVNVSVYASDAQTRMLPLLGGDSVIHDWHHILSSLGLLEHTTLIGSILLNAGVLVMFTAVALPLYFGYRKVHQLG